MVLMKCYDMIRGTPEKISDMFQIPSDQGSGY